MNTLNPQEQKASDELPAAEHTQPAAVPLKILRMEEQWVAVHKPAGLLVHRTGWSPEKTVVLQMLRDQLGKKLFPVHRLDRGTAGVLLFAFNPDAARTLQRTLESGAAEKTYLAIVRGWLRDEGRIEVPLGKDGTGILQPALTTYKCLYRTELPVPIDRYCTARYSLAEIQIHTGRYHQIRRHFAHIRHPVIGDLKRGDRHHNRFWREQLGIKGIHLLSWKLKLPHPETAETVLISTAPDEHMRAGMEVLGFGEILLLHK